MRGVDHKDHKEQQLFFFHESFVRNLTARRKKEGERTYHN